jgi:amino acid adenylation domain-containing protein
MLLHDAFIENSLINPNKVAVKTEEGTLTYAELHDRGLRLAHQLNALGLLKNDRVVIFMDNSLDICISIIGVLMAGGVFVLVNPTTKYDKLCYVLNDSQARILITQARRNLDCAKLLQDAPALTSIISDKVDEASTNGVLSLAHIYTHSHGSQPLPRIIDIDLAALIYTSGSTGNPKGVMMTHHNMVAAANSIITYLENTPSDIILNVLPMSFDYGLYQLLMSITFGGTLILEKDFIYPSVIVQKLREERVTGFPGVPTVFAMLFKTGVLDRVELPALRYVTNTGAALPVEFIKKLRGYFPQARIYSMYGLTECKRVAFLPPEDIDRKPGSVGRAMPNCEVYLVDDSGQPVAPGEIGELCIRGSNVMQGYWNLPEETTNVLAPGNHPYEKALRSGDLFKMDDEGYLYFVARKDDIIKSRGEKVSPKEVENVLYQLEGIEEAVVIGVQDNVLGEAVKAFVKVSPSHKLTERQVIQHCMRHLENFCVPKFIEFVDELPKSANGKIDKKQLKAKVVEAR